MPGASFTGTAGRWEAVSSACTSSPQTAEEFRSLNHKQGSEVVLKLRHNLDRLEKAYNDIQPDTIFL